MIESGLPTSAGYLNGKESDIGTRRRVVERSLVQRRQARGAIKPIPNEKGAREKERDYYKEGRKWKRSR